MVRICPQHFYFTTLYEKTEYKNCQKLRVVSVKMWYITDNTHEGGTPYGNR